MFPFTKHTLSNGLDVIVHEDHATPLVAVSIWYHVGSKNEHRGRTGLAHLFEHLMFEGSAHQPRGYFEPLQEAGGTLNGSTNSDRTNYWEVVPAGAARLALWMEADRMGWLLPTLSQARFDTQREVVLNERRQSYENRPYGLAQFALLQAVFPETHPYHMPTIGSPEDLRAATVDDARAFFVRFYHPRNASLAIGGDIETSEALVLAEGLFSEIPAGPPIVTPEASIPAPHPRRFVIEDRVELSRLYLVWPSPGLFGADDAELDFVADLLANGRTARLYRKLIYEQRIATELAANQSSRELCGYFQIVATAAPGHSLMELYDAVTSEVASFIQTGPTEQEVARGRIQAEAAFAHRLQTLGGFGGKTDQLNAYNVFRGTPDYFETDLRRYLDAGADDLRKAAARWLDPAAVVTLSVMPMGGQAQALPMSDRLQVA
jgi:zinc protease